MALVTLSGVRKSFGAQEVLRDASFTVDERERAALIGPNGSGKTTLLRIILGEQPADAGSVTLQPGTTVGYLPQEVDLPEAAPLQLAVMAVTPELLACASELAVIQKQMSSAAGNLAQSLGGRFAEVSHRFDTLHGFDYQVRSRAILNGLGFDESEFDKPVRSLSGGQKTRAALAKLLLRSPDILLLDEPTNHLDIQACEWLQEFLQTRYSGAALIVSHDRYFLDRVAGKVIAIEDGAAVTYRGAYTDYARQRAAKLEELQRLYKSRQKEIARIEAAIQTLFSHRKFSRRDSKLKQLERIRQVDRVAEARTISANLAGAVRSGREVIRLSGLTKSYPGRKLFSGVDFVLERGQKVGIVGPNGSGKTTLLRIIAGRESPDEGEVSLGHNVRPVYFAQEFDHLVPDRTVIEELLADSEISAKAARDLLARFLFMGDDAFKKVAVLSGGEQCRLALAKVLAGRPNLLLLDEPTNHLDVPSREALEAALREFDGTLMVASHDRYLLDAVATDIAEISGGAFERHHGNYSAYRERSARRGPDPRSGSEPVRHRPPPTRPLTALRENERLLRRLERRRAELESEAHELEARQRELAEALGDQDSYRSGAAGQLSRDYDEVTARLDATYRDWEEVCGQSEEIRRLLES